nr:unnamed protein product [Callosobruchus analis]
MFRRLLNKVKPSLKSSAGREGVATPLWFAYETMKNFLHPVYFARDTISTDVNLIVLRRAGAGYPVSGGAANGKSDQADWRPKLSDICALIEKEGGGDCCTRESSIKSSSREVNIALEEHIDKRGHENGIALFGIPEGDTRTLPDTIANSISAKFKIEVTVDDIHFCYRMGAGARADKKGKHPRPVGVYFVNRWLRDKVFFAKSNLKGSGVVMSEMLTENALQLYKQTKTILGAKNVWTWRGDFNIDLLDFESAEANYVTDIIEGFGKKQLVKQPTRITENTATLIDYMVVSNEEIVSDVGTIPAAELDVQKCAYFRTMLDNRNNSNSLWAAVKELGITKRKTLNLPENLSSVDDIN